MLVSKSIFYLQPQSSRLFFFSFIDIASFLWLWTILVQATDSSLSGRFILIIYQYSLILSITSFKNFFWNNSASFSHENFVLSLGAFHTLSYHSSYHTVPHELTWPLLFIRFFLYRPPYNLDIRVCSMYIDWCFHIYTSSYISHAFLHYYLFLASFSFYSILNSIFYTFGD